MLAKIFLKTSFKRVILLSFGALAIGALANCGSSSGGGGGGGGTTAPAAGNKDPGTDPDENQGPGTPDLGCTAGNFVFEEECVSGVDFPNPGQTSSACTDELSLEVKLNDETKCLIRSAPAADFILMPTVVNNVKSWPNTNVTVILAANNAALAVKNCSVIKNIVEEAPSTFMADFSNHFTCEVLLKSKTDEQQVEYRINILHGVGEAGDFQIPYFASGPANFVLTQDIQLAAAQNSLVTSFKGTLDGKDRKISGLSIEAGTSGDDNVGLISQIALSADDATVEIKNLNLEITSLTGKNNVGGLIGMIDSSEGAKAVQIKRVMVTFAGGASLKCNLTCGGLVGRADASVHFSKINLTGTVSYAGGNVGGVVGHASGVQLSEVSSTLSMNHSENRKAIAIGLVAGLADQASALSNISASGTITCTGSCERVGGVVGYLEKSSVSAVKSVLTLETGTGGMSIGGVVGEAVSSSLTRLYAKLTTDNDNGQLSMLGAAVGQISGGLFDLLVSRLELSSNGKVSEVGGAAGNVVSMFPVARIFASGSMAGSGTFTNTGQLIGRIASNLVLQHSYTGSFTGDSTPEAAVGMAASSPIIMNSYTRADKFVAGDAEQIQLKVDFNNVYASLYSTTPKGEKIKQLGKIGEVKTINVVSSRKPKGSPENFTSQALEPDKQLDLTPSSQVSSVDQSRRKVWVDAIIVGKNVYTYPLLKYPSEDMGPISEDDWYEFQIIDNVEYPVIAGYCTPPFYDGGTCR